MQGERASRVRKGLAVVQMELYCSLGILAIPPPQLRLTLPSYSARALSRMGVMRDLLIGQEPWMIGRPSTRDTARSLTSPFKPPSMLRRGAQAAEGLFGFIKHRPLSVPRQSYDHADGDRVTDYSGRFSDPH